MSESTTSGKRKAETPRKSGVADGSRRLRSIVASLVWLVAVVAALCLAAGALLVALRFNLDNPIVDAITTVASRIDFGVLKEFDVPKGAKQSAIDDAQIKSVLVNWGIAALGYLVVGKVLDRVIRPRG